MLLTSGRMLCFTKDMLYIHGQQRGATKAMAAMTESVCLRDSLTDFRRTTLFLTLLNIESHT